MTMIIGSIHGHSERRFEAVRYHSAEFFTLRVRDDDEAKDVDISTDDARMLAHYLIGLCDDEGNPIVTRPAPPALVCGNSYVEFDGNRDRFTCGMLPGHYGEHTDCIADAPSIVSWHNE